VAGPFGRAAHDLERILSGFRHRLIGAGEGFLEFLWHEMAPRLALTHQISDVRGGDFLQADVEGQRANSVGKVIGRLPLEGARGNEQPVDVFELPVEFKPFRVGPIGDAAGGIGSADHPNFAGAGEAGFPGHFQKQSSLADSRAE